jgi:hypothetical protein
MSHSPSERIAFTARLTSISIPGKLLEILSARVWTLSRDLTWRKDVLEPGEHHGDANHRRASGGRADYERPSH